MNKLDQTLLEFVEHFATAKHDLRVTETEALAVMNINAYYCTGFIIGYLPEMTDGRQYTIRLGKNGLTKAAIERYSRLRMEEVLQEIQEVRDAYEIE